MTGTWHKIKILDYKVHLFMAFFIRLSFVWYSVYHDQLSTVPYTDIDYKVFTDASRYILNNQSPYNRHTYRYSPIIAILLIPNLIIHHTFGKILFSLIDLLVGVLIRLIVINTLKQHKSYITNENVLNKCQSLTHSDEQMTKQKQNSSRLRKKQKNQSIKANISIEQKDYTYIMANISMFMWLYNPMSIAIATRGNCDSIAGFLVLATLYFLQCKKEYFVAGLIHGAAIHVRLYPIVYSLALFMYLSNFSFYESKNRREHEYLKERNRKSVSCKDGNNLEVIDKSGVQNRKTIFKKEYLLYLVPNMDQLKLVSGCLLSLACFTSLFYHLYGYKFLYETYIYHLVRNDSKHNFSLYFYLQYLTVGIRNIGIWQKVLMVLPKIVLLLILSVRYGLNKYSLNFSILTQTIVMVIYNTVLTSQYFIWVMAILPLCTWFIQISIKKTVLLFGIWFAAQLAWLLPAYFLEFQGHNTFLLIWIQSVSFFCANIAILGRLIKYFIPISVHRE